MKHTQKFLALLLVLALLLPSVAAQAIDGAIGGVCPRSPTRTHQWGDWKVTSPGTCVTKGRETHTCLYCRKTEFRQASFYGDHDWGEWETEKAPTATEPGLEKRVCKIEPSHVEEREIPPLGQGSTEDGPALTVEWKYDHITKDVTNFEYDTLDTGVLAPEDDAIAYVDVVNTGSVPLDVCAHWSFGDGFVMPGGELDAPLAPGASAEDARGTYIGSHITPGTETDELLGTVSIIVWASGHDPQTGEELCRSNEVTRVWPVGKPAAEKPSGRTVSMAVRKVWDDGDNADGVRPRQVKAALLADGLPVQTVTLGEANRWMAGLDGLPLYAKDGHRIEYAWQEEEVPGYTQAITQDGTHTVLINSRTVDDGPHPDISVVISADPDAGEGQRSEWGWLTIHYKVTNTGDCPVYVPWWQDDEQGGMNVLNPDAPNGKTVVEGMNLGNTVALLNPGESYTDDTLIGVYPDDVENGYSKIYLIGEYYYYDADSDIQKSGIVNSNTLTVPLTYPENGGNAAAPSNTRPRPDLSVVISADPDAGVGKRYAGAQLTVHYSVTNTGDCPVHVSLRQNSALQTGAPDGAAARLDPGEAYTTDLVMDVKPDDAQNGYAVYYFPQQDYYYEYYDSAAAAYQTATATASSNALPVYLTYPEGGEATQETPALTAVFLYDHVLVCSDQSDYCTASPGVLAPEDDVYSYFDVINSGNVPLKIYTHLRFGNGYSSLPCDTEQCLNPGESLQDYWCAAPLSFRLTPDTETEELLGTVTMTIWATGNDPETGEEKAKSNEITRVWQVGKPGPMGWEIPEESALAVILYESSSSEDPAGYQWMEDWNTGIAVENVGPVDVDGYTLHVGFLSSQVYISSISYDATDNATWYEKRFTNTIPASGVNDLYFFGPFGRIVDEDVSRGYVGVSAYATWNDPDSGEERHSATAAFSLPVVSDTGLLLTKSVDNYPANGLYFTEGETIAWKLTVTNNSSEPAYHVTVIDGGLTVGEFDVLAPGESRVCSVPGHVVTEYEAGLGYVYNQAYASCAGLDGGWYYYHSNMVTAYTGEQGDPDPQIGDPLVIPAPGGDDFCSLTRNTLARNEMHYTLHACAAHSDAARRAEAAGAAEAAAIWRAEIDQLYQQLCDAAQTGAMTLVRNEEDASRAYVSTPEAQDAAAALVRNDQAAFHAYADAYEALYGEEALAEMLRLRCAELCCMLRTAPSALPDSIQGRSALPSEAQYDECAREFGPLNGSDSEVTVRLNESLSGTLEQALATVSGTKPYAAAQALVQTQAQWQMALDKTVNAAYKAADKETRQTIAAWRKQLDQLLTAREALLAALYPNSPATVQEALANLYRDAAIDANLKN